MKIAQTVDGHPIEAKVTAPKQAKCPQCGVRLTLRSRRVMGTAAKTYFWRHTENMKHHCRARR